MSYVQSHQPPVLCLGNPAADAAIHTVHRRMVWYLPFLHLLISDKPTKIITSSGYFLRHFSALATFVRLTSSGTNRHGTTIVSPYDSLKICIRKYQILGFSIPILTATAAKLVFCKSTFFQ